MQGTLRHASKTAVHPVELAWILTIDAERWLTTEERLNAYVKLGAGDTEAAISDLIGVVVREQVGLSHGVVAALWRWLAGYPDGKERDGIQALLASVLVKPDEIARPAPRYLEISSRYRRQPSGLTRDMLGRYQGLAEPNEVIPAQTGSDQRC